MINELATVKCRYGCEGGVFVIVEVEDGCACWPDKIQALCHQHWISLEPVGKCRVIFDWMPAPQSNAAALCPKCHGHQTSTDSGNRPCKACGGSGFQSETEGDTK